MRDFRLPNVLTRAGKEGDYVVIDLEYAGPTGQPWNQASALTGWDNNTLTMVRRLAIIVPFVGASDILLRRACCLVSAAALLEC